MGKEIYVITAFENVGPERMWRYAPGDPLVYVGTFEFYAHNEHDALERLWVVGNRQGSDIGGRLWPSTQRSQCSGDVAVVNGRTYAALTVGWGFAADQPGRTYEVERDRTATGGIALTFERCTSDTPLDHQGDTCPVHENSDYVGVSR